MKRFYSVFFLIIAMCLCTVISISVSAKTNPDFSYEEWRGRMRQQGLFDETVMVPMRDGVKLSTTIFKSPLGGPFPTILVRTPYGKDDERLEPLQLIILKGYALVIQDVRGRFGSEGENIPFVNDGWGQNQDGYDTIEWIAQQKWSDGKVGTWGPSAMGILQSLAAATRPPHLVCQVIGYAASEGFGQATYQSGVFREELVSSWLSKINAFSVLSTYRQHNTYDAYWEQMNIELKYAEMNVPSLFIGGWYDIFQKGTLNDFAGRQNQSMTGALGKQKLIIGPWTHVTELKDKQGELTYPADSMFSDEIDYTLKWFDYWLKGSNSTIMSEPAVKYYVMGDVSDSNAPGNEWRTSNTWPIATQDMAFYLQTDGTLARTVSSQGSLTLKVDSSQPVPTKGGANLDLPAGPYDQSALESRSDVLVFSTEVLENPLEVIGRIHLTLYAESNLTDNDITVRITDVYPDGRSMLVCDGVARASFRDSWTNPSAITPGQVYAYEVDCWSTAMIFNTGHRVRIIVANSNYPRFELNPLYKQLGQNGVPAEAVTTLHLSSEYPSSLYLPMIWDGTHISDWSVY